MIVRRIVLAVFLTRIVVYFFFALSFASQGNAGSDAFLWIGGVAGVATAVACVFAYRSPDNSFEADQVALTRAAHEAIPETHSRVGLKVLLTALVLHWVLWSAFCLSRPYWVLAEPFWVVIPAWLVQQSIRGYNRVRWLLVLMLAAQAASFFSSLFWMKQPYTGQFVMAVVRAIGYTIAALGVAFSPAVGRTVAAGRSARARADWEAAEQAAVPAAEQNPNDSP